MMDRGRWLSTVFKTNIAIFRWMSVHFCCAASTAIASCKIRANVKKCELTASHIFGLLYKLKPFAGSRATGQPLLATRVPILHDFVVVYSEIIYRRLFLERTRDRRPRAFAHDREFVPSVVQQQRDHRFRHLCIRWFSSSERAHFRGLVVRAFLQWRTEFCVNIWTRVSPSFFFFTYKTVSHTRRVVFFIYGIICRINRFRADFSLVRSSK